MTPKVKNCGPKPALSERDLVEPTTATHLEELFKVLANDTRIRLLHVLVRSGEAPVSDICAELDMTPQAVSSHLQKLSASGILGSRREGNFIFYRILDPCIPVLLERGLCLLEEREKQLLG